MLEDLRTQGTQVSQSESFNISQLTGERRKMLSVGQEDAPRVDRVDASNFPPPPPGTKLAVDIDCSISSYPVLLRGGYIFWPLSYIDNRMSMAIVQTNATGAIIKTVEATGARYINSIQVDTANKRVAFVGQAGMVASLSWSVLLAPPSINLGQFATPVESGKTQALNVMLHCTLPHLHGPLQGCWHSS